MAICVHRALCSVSLCCDCCRLSQITGLWGVSISQFANINATSLGLFEKCALHVSDLPFTLADLSLPLFTACISAFYLYFSSGLPYKLSRCQSVKCCSVSRYTFWRGRGPHINIHLHECSSGIKIRGDFLRLSWVGFE